MKKPMKNSMAAISTLSGLVAITEVLVEERHDEEQHGNAERGELPWCW
ncbi:MAG: hypothetical protein U1E76_02300 [Planctomycetota bacterium]